MEKDVVFLEQMIKSLEKLESRLEEYYKRRDTENFNKTKRIMLEIQKKISEVADAV
ncbi:MAG TPA: hypothetical protein VJ208_02270 [Candidatus Nanoarchaeia archaeon]|nr:hypothetical protein [Candidatus Nanoarchaeia archaeon]